VFNFRLWLLAAFLPVCFGAGLAHAQIDPTKRELIQLGYNQPLQGHAPIAGYAFYYYNQPGFLRTNLTLRLAVAPVYVDSELGIANTIGPYTDLGFGLAGGGFADSYSEIRQGKYLREESFTGNGGQVSASIYHRFNPDQRIPLAGIFRTEVAFADYERDDTTAPTFVLPRDQTSFNIRTGFRWGGKEPLLAPDVGLELSVWYEGKFRPNAGPYGFSDDRRVESASHLFWARALFAYTLPERKDNFMFSVTAGTSIEADRFSAYRIGGNLPLASEFPLSIPGYFYQELSASRFVLLNGTYYMPLDAHKRWELTAVASTAAIDYLPGLQQPGHWNSGAGGGITYHASSQAWRIFLGYGYGFDAIRTGGRGAHSVGFLVQFDLERTKGPFYDPGANNSWSRGLDRVLHSFE
jgi:hypothetical protein